MTAPLATPVPTGSPRPERRITTWTLWGVPAGGFGVLATLFFNQRPQIELETPGHTVVPTDINTLDPGVAHLGLVFGYLSVACLLILAGQWRRRVESRFDWSSGAPVVSSGLTASAATLSLAYGWIGGLSRYLPGAPEEHGYDEQGRFVYFMLTDFSPYIGWLGVLVAAGAIGWMAWRERLVSRVLGTCAGLAATVLFVLTLVTGIPGLPGIMGVFLVIGSVWLSVGRSVVTSTDD